MKKCSYLLSLIVISLLALTSCSKTPNEVNFTFKSFDVEVHTDLQKGFIEADDTDSYVSQHDMELASFSNSAPN